jgi:hypothetical protein
MRARIGLFLAGAGLLVIAATTLIPLPRQAAASQLTPLWCLVCGDYGGVDVVCNVLLFIPLAIGLRLLGVRVGGVVAIGSLASLAIETLQLTVITGRDASLSDLLTNSLGSWIGALVGTHQGSLLRPTAKQAIRLTGFGAVTWLTVQLTTAGLLRPWVPSEALRGAWARSVPGRDTFDGRVTAAFLLGTTVPDGSEPIDPEQIIQMQHTSVRLELGLLTGRGAAMWSPVFELLGPHGAVLAVEAVRQDLVFQPPMGSYSLRLRRPALRMPEALRATPGSPVRITAGERQARLWARWTTAGVEHGSVQVLSPSFGWSLLTPFKYAYGPEVRWITAAWITGWLAPLGYWLARARVGRAATLGVSILPLLAGLGLVPRLTGYAPVHWSEWLAAVAGAGIGWAGSRFATYFEERCDSPSIKESC